MELTQLLDNILEQMLMSTEINIRNRTFIPSKDSLGNKVTLLAIPTPED
jgi:hypothetical protein